MRIVLGPYSKHGSPMERILSYRLKVKPHEGQYAVFIDGVPTDTGLSKERASIVKQIKLDDMIRKVNTEKDKLASAASKDA